MVPRRPHGHGPPRGPSIPSLATALTALECWVAREQILDTYRGRYPHEWAAALARTASRRGRDARVLREEARRLCAALRAEDTIPVTDGYELDAIDRETRRRALPSYLRAVPIQIGFVYPSFIEGWLTGLPGEATPARLILEWVGEMGAGRFCPTPYGDRRDVLAWVGRSGPAMGARVVAILDETRERSSGTRGATTADLLCDDPAGVFARCRDAFGDIPALVSFGRGDDGNPFMIPHEDAWDVWVEDGLAPPWGAASVEGLAHYWAETDRLLVASERAVARLAAPDALDQLVLLLDELLGSHGPERARPDVR